VKFQANLHLGLRLVDPGPASADDVDRLDREIEMVVQGLHPGKRRAVAFSIIVVCIDSRIVDRLDGK